MFSIKKKGFTLVELLVVISVIGILTTVVLTALSGARQKAKDAAFQRALQEIPKAMELYYLDHDAYPTTPYSFTLEGNINDEWDYTQYSEFFDAVEPYIDFRRIAETIPEGGRISFSNGSQLYDRCNPNYGGASIPASDQFYNIGVQTKLNNWTGNYYDSTAQDGFYMSNYYVSSYVNSMGATNYHCINPGY